MTHSIISTLTEQQPPDTFVKRRYTPFLSKPHIFLDSVGHWQANPVRVCGNFLKTYDHPDTRMNRLAYQWCSNTNAYNQLRRQLDKIDN